MRKYRALKIAAFAVSALVSLSITKEMAYASKPEQSMTAEYGIAGISKTLDNVFSCGDNEVNDKITELFNSKIYSPLSSMGVSVATSYVNVRSQPSTESEVVGKLYHGCAAEILEWLEGDWVKIVSGEVEGYIASNYLVVGRDAEREADEHAEKYATVIRTQTLRVREEPSQESRTLELIPLGERYPVIKEYDNWAEILISSDDQGNDFTGFVHKDYISVEIKFQHAISIEEEQRIIREQQEAERAEAERLQRLAEEKEQRRLAEERKAAEEKKKSEEAKKNKNNSSSSNSSSSNNSSSSSNVGSASGNEVANYAQKFVGNPYKWGGTSLTKGADCSGFLYTIYGQFGYDIPRVSRDQAAGAGRRVDISERQPGDLIFYTNSSGTVNHVAMYIGDDKIVHAANKRQGIIISKYNYRKVYCVRRVV